MRIKFCIIFVTCRIAVSYAQVEHQRNPDKVGEDTTAAKDYLQLADSLYKASQYDSSNYYFQKAGLLYKKAENWEKYVLCNYRIGWNYNLTAEYNNAIKILQNGLAVGLEKIGNDHIVIAKCYTVFGAVYRNKGNYGNALEYYQKSLSIILNIPDNDSRSAVLIAVNYNNIGIVYWDKGYFDKALEFYQKSLSIRLNTLGQRHPHVAASYGNIGTICFEKGDYYYALEYYQQALLIHLEYYGKIHPEIGSDYNNIGNIYLVTGEYENALKYYRQSLEINLEVFGSEHPYTATDYNNMGNAYADKSNYNRAMELYEQALRIRIKTFGKEHPLVASCYSNIGSEYTDKKDYAEAIVFQNKALAIYKNTFGGFHHLVGTVYISIAAIYVRKAQSPECQGVNDMRYPPCGMLLDTALFYHQKALHSLVKGFADNSIYVNPVLKKIFIPGKTPKIEGVQSMPVLLDALEGKAEAFYERCHP